MRGLAMGLVLLLATATQAEVAAGQQDASCSVLLLEPDHWAVDALRHLEAQGLIDAQLVSRTPTVCRVRELLRGASQRSPLGEALARRLEREFGGGTIAALSRGKLEVGGLVTADRTAPGFGEFEPERTGAVPIDDQTRLIGRLALAVDPSDRISIAGALHTDPAERRLQQLEISGKVGGLIVGLGRGAEGMGYSARGAIVNHGLTGLHRLRVATEAPGLLPSFLRYVGPVGFSGFLGRLDEPRHQKEPFFLGGAVSARPHPRLTMAVHRGAMFGGESVDIGAADLLNMLIGRVAGIGFENQVVSVQGSWRLPTEPLIPLTAYFDWGAEDAAGSWTHVPGQLWGISLPELPGIPSTSLALEFVRFEESCCFNPEWYRHQSFLGSWASGDRPLGHPLGGHGSEFAVILQSFSRDGRLFSDVQLFTREREFENLYVPGRAGRSIGADVEASHDPGDHLRLRVQASLESGDGWTEKKLEATVLLFP